ncbi:hypothetical protein [Corynebacterium alimapuense]|uniref:Porin n=1 Tax=Corynebacterium alimapuense TaxID=1576874 RepID=A0A3M8K9T2_9CORY|nr:hypothetical protein [Corynebacterium alimapuense]RNE49896.1 hypothetical protein C5L39_00530 [Corynebacterium alimapuense]
MDIATLIAQFEDFSTVFGGIDAIVGGLQDLFGNADKGTDAAIDELSSIEGIFTGSTIGDISSK